MLFRLILLFTIIPLVELAILVKLSQVTSLTTTIVIVLATGILGAWLARWQGWRTVQRIQRELRSGQMPAEAMFDGLLILVAGAVLLTPGLITDAFGFLLLTPPFRAVVRRKLQARFKSSIPGRSAHFSADGFDEPGSTPPRDEIIDVRVIEKESDEISPP